MKLRLLPWMILASGIALTQMRAADPAGGDAWQAQLNQRLDASISRIQMGGGNPPPRAAGAAPAKSTSALEAAAAGGSNGQGTMVAALLREQGLPPGLASVVAVESAFNPLALSPKGARGLWQLMPDTARRYGLTVAPNLDERIDPVRSTQAAGAYLKDLFAQFGNWPLALASYNAGEARVSRALTQTGAQNFWTLRRRGALPEETLQYVPAVLERLRDPLEPPIATGGDLNTDALQTPPTTGRVVYATAQ
jgi:soluble lytic murein transglycosylase-like protein